MKKLYILSALLTMGTIASAQNYEEILRFSRFTTTGTARSAAMGGAFGALGGDLSTLSTNPAGIGVFRKSEAAFTPLLNFNDIKSGNRTANKTSFQMGTLGAVFSLYTPDFNWRGFNFGINYTNLSNYNRQMDIAVLNSSTSQLNAYALQADNIQPKDLNPFTLGQAYETFLINPNDQLYYSPAVGEGELVNQYKLLKEDGYQGEYAFSFGTNYKDKLYLGMTIGLQTTYFKTRRQHTELGEENAPSGFDSYDFFENVRINGVGTNLKFGAIYRPIPELRIGAAIHTPTWYNMNYRRETYIDAYYWTPEDPNTGRESQISQSQGYYDKYDFDMRTPWRAILSIATVLNQKAIISADYEYVDYGSAKYTAGPYSRFYDETNAAIKSTYTAAHNFRVGAEYRFNSQFSLRAGYNYMGSPYKRKEYSFVNSIPGGDKIQTVSGGIGLNFGQFYCDAAYSYRFAKDETIFYYTETQIDNLIHTVMAEPVSNKYHEHQARITVGVRF